MSPSPATIQSHLTAQVDDGPNPIRARSCPQTRERGLDFGVNAGIIAIGGSDLPVEHQEDCDQVWVMSGRNVPGRRLIVDITPLRESPRFRILYLGQLLAHFGRQITVVAVPYQVFLLTGSTLAVGALGIAQFIPLMAVSLVGGAVADAFDRRKLLVAGHLLLAMTAVGLMLNASATEPAVWPLYALSAVSAALSAINGPARMAAIPALLRRELLPSGFALNSTMHEVGAAVGPALAGVLIAQYSLRFTYAAEALALAAAAFTLAWVGPLRPEGGGRAVSVSSIVEGSELPEGPTASPVGVPHRSQRDDLRDAPRSVPRARELGYSVAMLRRSVCSTQLRVWVLCSPL